MPSNLGSSGLLPPMTAVERSRLRPTACAMTPWSSRASWSRSSGRSATMPTSANTSAFPRAEMQVRS